MSFVQAADGKFYENPVLWGTEWFALFAGDYEPEVAVRRHARTTRASGRSRAARLMREAGLRTRGLRDYDERTFFFPPEMEQAQAFSYQFTLTEPIPVPNKYDTVVSEPGDVWDHRIYGFFSEVSSEDCAKAVLGMDIVPLISKALLANAIYMKGRVRAEVCKKLYAQVPWLRELRHDDYMEQLRDKPPSVRIEWRVA